MGKKPLTRGAKIRNYTIASVLLALGIVPFVYTIVESIPAYNGIYLVDDRLVSGVEGIFQSVLFYLVFFFPMYLVALLLIVIAVVIFVYTGIRQANC